MYFLKIVYYHLAVTPLHLIKAVGISQTKWIKCTPKGRFVAL